MGKQRAARKDRTISSQQQIISRYQEKNVDVTPDYKLGDFTPTEKQTQIVKSLDWNDLTVVNGKAGTGKTSTALWAAINKLKQGETRKIIFLKNPTEVGDDQIGFLSGDKKDKLTAHYATTKRIFHQFISPGKLETDIANGKIELEIPNYALGATWDNSIVIIDEAQLMSPSTIKLLLERTGENTKVIMLGDVTQTYAVKNRQNGLADFVKRITVDGAVDVDFIGYITLESEDNMRSRLSQYITELY